MTAQSAFMMYARVPNGRSSRVIPRMLLASASTQRATTWQVTRRSTWLSSCGKWAIQASLRPSWVELDALRSRSSFLTLVKTLPTRTCTSSTHQTTSRWRTETESLKHQMKSHAASTISKLQLRRREAVVRRAMLIVEIGSVDAISSSWETTRTWSWFGKMGARSYIRSFAEGEKKSCRKLSSVVIALKLLYKITNAATMSVMEPKFSSLFHSIIRLISRFPLLFYLFTFLFAY